MRKLCRVLFSRYAISAIYILLSISVICALMFFAAQYSVIVYAVFVVVNLLIAFSVVNKEAHPEYKIPWLVIILAVPLFGGLLYYIFYSRKLSKKESKLLKRINDEADVAADALHSQIFSEHLTNLENDSPAAAGKARTILASDPCADIYRETVSKYYSQGEEMFDDMIKDMKGAKKYLFLEFFIVEQGEMWDRLFAVLKQKVEEGIDVRFLYDDVGCMKTLPANFHERIRANGIKCYRFAKVTPRVSSVHNNRDHRKIVVIDGRIAYTGGVNIADEYINKIERFGHWKDGGIKVVGHCALGLLKLFLTMWDLTVGTVSNYLEYFGQIEKSNHDDGGYYIPFGSGPAPIYTRSVGKEAFIDLINQSNKYLYITTPYLIIDYALTEAIKRAALRGVDVIIVTPKIPDKKKIKVMTKSSYPNLMSTGVKIYEYTPGFIHEKLVVTDDEYAIVGTINFDFRSLVHHYEDAVWMYKTPTVAEIKKAFLYTLSVSEQIHEKEAKLKLYEKLVKNLIRIFAPLL